MLRFKLRIQRVRVEFVLISIRAQNLPRPAGVAGEIAAPVQTLLNTREERGVLSWRLAFRSLCPNCSFENMSVRDTVYAHLLNMEEHQFPLGWYLSQHSQRKISNLLGNNSRCPLGKGEKVGRFEINHISDCLFAAVFSHLERPALGLTIPNKGDPDAN